MTTLIQANQISGLREVLTTNRTYYVRTDGSDSNDGLANTSGGAFLTIQKAVDVVASLDLSSYDATIQVGDGTYTAGVFHTRPFVGAGEVIIQGNASTPTNVVVSTSGTCFEFEGGVAIRIKNLKVVSSTGRGIWGKGGSQIYTSGVDFGACGHSHMQTTTGGTIWIEGAYTISGGAVWHYFASALGSIQSSATYTVTISGTPAFTNEFARGYLGGNLTIQPTVTYSGAVTGTRYLINMNATCYVGGAGASFFPGSIAGSTATGGQYA